MYYLGIEIGGTKLQIGLGQGDGKLTGLWRQTVNVPEGPEGIRRQIETGVPALLAKASIERNQLGGIGIGFGGPVDDATRTIIKSHQIEGWDGFPLAEWISDLVGLPAALGNDCDVAGLAETLFGAAKGMSPVFYITIGSGIGGGLILNGEIYRGCGRGAAEFGHMRFDVEPDAYSIPPTLEDMASGWALVDSVNKAMVWHRPTQSALYSKWADGRNPLTMKDIAIAAREDDGFAKSILEYAVLHIADGICHVIALLCPQRIVIGGGVSLMGEELLFVPLRKMVADRVFQPFAGLTDIVPAALGEEVVVHGALALARRRFGG
jgi:glucokinase